MVEERIYIGGLRPPRLSRRDIYRRLKALDQIEIESSSVVGEGEDEDDDSDSSDDNRPYLHITAISKSDSISAFSIIHKQYHNVKWKGCKLVVELAKPHFLERLKQERCDRQTRTNTTATVNNVITDAVQNQESNKLEVPSRIPRRLRVRRKYGDTALHVDTTPWSVESWSRFNKARTKLKKREEKHHIKLNDLKSHSHHDLTATLGPLMHRAVHIRFQKEVDSNENLLRNNSRNSNSNNNTAGVITSSDESSSDSDSSESESPQVDKYDKITESSRKPPSDDDSDSQNSNEKTNNAAKESDESASEQEQKSEVYQWSTDEESTDEDGENIISSLSSPRDHQQLVPTKFSQADEFVSGFQGASTFDESIEHPEDYEHLADEHNDGDDKDENLDLTGDVTTNLNILSSIFPDMANARPVNPDSGDAPNQEKDQTTQSSNAETRNNNKTHTLMPRFDPSAECSKKYIIEEESAKENKENEGNNPTEDVSVEGQPDDKATGTSDDEKPQVENDTNVPPVSSIYEQDKLENVFRNARNAWSAEDSNATITNNQMKKKNPEGSANKNTFQFGFNLGDSDQVEKPANETFSFSFNVPDQSQREVEHTSISTDLTIEQKDSTLIQSKTSSSNKEDSVAENEDSGNKEMIDHVPKRQKGYTMPDHDLQKYVKNFFSCNNGLSIIQDPQQLNDDEDREAWNNERRTLTLDWKRKRKYAMTRIQKRIKVRRR